MVFAHFEVELVMSHGIAHWNCNALELELLKNARQPEPLLLHPFKSCLHVFATCFGWNLSLQHSGTRTSNLARSLQHAYRLLDLRALLLDLPPYPPSMAFGCILLVLFFSSPCSVRWALKVGGRYLWTFWQFKSVMQWCCYGLLLLAAAIGVERWKSLSRHWCNSLGCWNLSLFWNICGYHIAWCLTLMLGNRNHSFRTVSATFGSWMGAETAPSAFDLQELELLMSHALCNIFKLNPLVWRAFFSSFLLSFLPSFLPSFLACFLPSFLPPSPFFLTSCHL